MLVNVGLEELRWNNLLHHQNVVNDFWILFYRSSGSMSILRTF